MKEYFIQKNIVFRPVIKTLYLVVAFSLLLSFVLVIKDWNKIDSNLWRNQKVRRVEWLNNQYHYTYEVNNTAYSKNTSQCMHEHFKNTLLIIAFGAASEYESIPLFEMLYKKVFINRIYCGNTPLNNQTDIKVKVVDTRYGAFLYDCLTQTMSSESNYTGYLFTGEDILLNYWNMLELDLDRIWEDDTILAGPRLYEQSEDKWEWWQSPWGIRAMEKVYEYLIELNYYDSRKAKLTQGDWLPSWDAGQALNAWLWNGGGEVSCFWSNKSIIYIPQSYKDLFLNISIHFRRSGVRHGIAIPSLTRLLMLDEEIIKLTSREINKSNSKDFLNKRELLTSASTENHLIAINENRKERRVILNDLRMKEYAVGKFLEYSKC